MKMRFRKFRQKDLMSKNLIVKIANPQENCVVYGAVICPKPTVSSFEER